MDEAIAVKAKFEAIKRRVYVWTEAEKREVIRRYLEQTERESGERAIYDAGDGGGPMYWRDHPHFQAGRSLH
jgi:hypothetical protein